MRNEEIKKNKIPAHLSVMIKKIIIVVLIANFSFLITNCNEPVFYTVSMQEKILEPIISGSPTNFVKIGDYVYVASGETIYYYDTVTDGGFTTAEKWESRSLGLGRINFIADNGSELFILTSKGVYKSTSLEPPVFGTVPLTAAAPYIYLSMYSANNEVFVGVRTNEDDSSKSAYEILRVNSGNLEIVAKQGIPDDVPYKNGLIKSTPLLRGVAYAGGTYYFCVKDQITENGGGILSGSVSSASLIGDYTKPFMGITELPGNKVYAITRNGELYNAATVEPLKNNNGIEIKMGRKSLGVLSVVEVNGKTFLLAGRQDSSDTYTNGYVEIEIDGSTGDIIGTAFIEPGINDNSTITNTSGNYEKFQTTLGKYPVTYIFDAGYDYIDVEGTKTPGEKLIFASTQIHGVWSLRQRKDDEGNLTDPYWNSES